MMYEFLEYQTQDVMTRDPVTIEPNSRIDELMECFAKHDFNSVPVIGQEGELLGVVTKLDLLRAFRFDDEHMFPPYDEILERPVSTIMERDVRTMQPRTPLHRVLEQMVTHKCKSFPVVDDEKLVGVVAREDVMRGLALAHAGNKEAQ